MASVIGVPAAGVASGTGSIVTLNFVYNVPPVAPDQMLALFAYCFQDDGPANQFSALTVGGVPVTIPDPVGVVSNPFNTDFSARSVVGYIPAAQMPAPGNQVVSASMDNSGVELFLNVGIDCVEGVDQSGFLDVNQAATGGGGSVSQSPGTAATGALGIAIAWDICEDTGAINIPAGWTGRLNFAPTDFRLRSAANGTTGVNITPTFSGPAAPWHAAVVTFAVPSSSSGIFTTKQRQQRMYGIEAWRGGGSNGALYTTDFVNGPVNMLEVRASPIEFINQTTERRTILDTITVRNAILPNGSPVLSQDVRIGVYTSAPNLSGGSLDGPHSGKFLANNPAFTVTQFIAHRNRSVVSLPPISSLLGVWPLLALTRAQSAADQSVPETVIPLGVHLHTNVFLGRLYIIALGVSSSPPDIAYFGLDVDYGITVAYRES